MTGKHPERPPRVNIVEHCTVVRESGRVVRGLLVNLSDEGFCVDSDPPLLRGERVEVRVQGIGRLCGIVRWLDCNRAGGVLERYSRGAYDR